MQINRPPPLRRSAVGSRTLAPQQWLARLSAGLVLMALAATAVAQAHVSEAGNYVLRSSVVSSTAIAESTARAHGIEPGPHTAVLNVVVMKKDGQQRRPVAAEVDAEIRNLLGATHSVELKEVEANGRVSYVSPFDHAFAEALDFRITARPRDGGPELTLEFRERIGAAGGRS